MKLPRRLGIALAGFTLVAGSLVAGVAQADVTATGQTCTEFPGGSNDDIAKVSVVPDYFVTGYVEFRSSGEVLTVQDITSNGRRIVALFSWCDDGIWHPYVHRDSGPDEGPTDTQTYKFDFAEGRGIKFVGCEKNMSTGALYHCTKIKYTHA